ncbi:MAG: hypothetical protein K6G80_12120 [Treponema sp.]|nr:hypothetical protein [Treponema sp.]
MQKLIIDIQNGPRIEQYMDVRHAKAQNLLRVMKTKDWGFVRYVPTIDKIRHQYCILPISDISEEDTQVRRIGAYVFNYSVVEKKSLLAQNEFQNVLEIFGKSREPFIGFIGPLAQDDLSYRLLMVNDELSIMPGA